MSDERRWRLAKINGDMSGHFFTIQFGDYGVLPYRTDWREHYADLIASEPLFEPSETGNRYGEWHDGDWGER